MRAATRLEHLEDADIDSMSAAQAQAALHDIAVIRGTTDQLEAALARRLSTLHEQGQGVPAADALSRNGRSSRQAAERAERRAGTLGSTPQLDEALGAGKVGAEHADALTNAAAHLDDVQREQLFGRDEEITELAESCSPEKFRRRISKLVDDITDDDGLDRAEKQRDAATAFFKVDDESGMHRLIAHLAPEQGNRIRRALDAEVSAMAKLPEFTGLRRDQLLARALDRLVCGDGASHGLGPAEVSVLIDHASLIGGAHGGTVSEYSDGTPIPVETARRHACDAGIIPVVLGGESQPLDVGRARRLATPAQRNALRSMYRTCAIDGCDQHFDRCHVHHLQEWESLGDTDLANLVPVCSFHHHRAHEGRWRLQLDASTRQLTVSLPDGSLHSQALPDLLAERLAA